MRGPEVQPGGAPKDHPETPACSAMDKAEEMPSPVPGASKRRNTDLVCVGRRKLCWWG